MKILADENMPYVQQLFGDLGTIETVNGRELTSEQVNDADVLLVRSVTKVNQALLAQNNQLKFVGSATIGTDHIDLDYLASRNIPFSNAPGCNATAVGEFTFIAMLELAQRYNSPLKGKMVGIVGAGNTGTAVAKCLEAYGIEFVLNDPLLEESGDPRDFVSLETLIEKCDVISLHVPITKTGKYKTWYLFDQARLNSLGENTWLLNCCRGEVIDNRALIKFKQQRDDVKVVLDVWEGEPHPMADLVPYVEFCTPHIAGYSLEGKARGTYMLYQKLAEVLGIEADKQMESLLPALWSERVDVQEFSDERALLQLARFVYDLRDDDELFRKMFLNNQGFDHMRKNHTHRREFSALKVGNTGQTNVNWLSNLGFSGVEL
ncbi:MULTISPECIES: 4-phosphoerythronate dehydrogenase [unclassified Shewanella]|uniref:4-phosphoerythronate dehydrogenase n=1 Tax=unclassified Shewanella TaxID=196818 RepID=UPI001BBC7432|nr:MULTISPECIES: 4-phosphoerythronate dehydrogenase [unclassified Shewanella]GIU08506.1 erythronate-4-phosphate dehydrogenase [Shewanella sp. MBTL60-112-B1]GIU38449.1 erythronate-4-phosphate dehydrogenase [Shewanella sp. MBTL60-112-B2]